MPITKRLQVKKKTGSTEKIILTLMLYAGFGDIFTVGERL